MKGGGGCASRFHEIEPFFDPVKPLIDPIETAIVVRQRRAVLRQRLFDLAYPELHILNIVLHPFLAATDKAQMVKDEVVRLLGHKSHSTGKELRLKKDCADV